MNGLSQWARSHKPQAAAIAAAIVVAIVVATAVASGAFATSEQQPEQQEPRTVDVALNVTADHGWDENSTPAIAHIEGNDVDFYHAVTPDAEGNKGTSTVELAEGDYTVSFVSPVNSDAPPSTSMTRALPSTSPSTPTRRPHLRSTALWRRFPPTRSPTRYSRTSSTRPRTPSRRVTRP